MIMGEDRLHGGRVGSEASACAVARAAEPAPLFGAEPSGNRVGFCVRVRSRPPNPTGPEREP